MYTALRGYGSVLLISEDWPTCLWIRMQLTREISGTTRSLTSEVPGDAGPGSVVISAHERAGIRTSHWNRCRNSTIPRMALLPAAFLAHSPEGLIAGEAAWPLRNFWGTSRRSFSLPWKSIRNQWNSWAGAGTSSKRTAISSDRCSRGRLACHGERPEHRTSNAGSAGFRASGRWAEEEFDFDVKRWRQSVWSGRLSKESDNSRVTRSVYRREQTSSKGNWLRTGKAEAALSHIGFAGCSGRASGARWTYRWPTDFSDEARE